MSQALRTAVRDGQPYVDQPVYAKPKLVQRNVALALGDAPPDPRAKLACVFRHRDGRDTDRPWQPVQVPMPLLVRYDRIALRWMKPDGKGGLVPR